MVLYIYVSPASAVKAGKSQSGVLPVDLSPELLASLSPEEREDLATWPGLGTPMQHATDHRSLPEATPDAVVARVRERVAETEAQRAELESNRRERIARAEAWLATYEPLPDSDLASGDLKGRPWDVDAGSIGEPLAQRVKALIARNEQAIHCRQEKEATAAAQEWLAAHTAPDLVQIEAKDGILRAKSLDVPRRWAGGHTDPQPDVLEALRALDSASEALAKARNADLEASRAEALQTAVREWGTPSQQARQAEGLLSQAEALRLVRDQIFAGLSDQPRYERLTAESVDHVDCLEPDMAYKVGDATDLSAEAFEVLQQIRRQAPKGAEVTIRCHAAWCACAGSDRVDVDAALVSLDWHGWRLSREYDLTQPGPATYSRMQDGTWGRS